MFDFLLKPLSPISVFYNWAVVNYVFPQLTYDPIQSEQIVANYNYNPFAGAGDGNDDNDNDTVNGSNLTVDAIEQDYLAVNELLEDECDDDYSLADAVVPEMKPVYTVGYLGTFISSVVGNITHSLMFGALLSCDFALSKTRSFRDFVQVKSREAETAPTAAAAQPKMRGFGVDFGQPKFKPTNFMALPDPDLGVPDIDFTVPDTDDAAVVPVYPRWVIPPGNEVACRREAFRRYNREHNDNDSWGFAEDEFSIQDAN